MEFKEETQNELSDLKNKKFAEINSILNDIENGKDAPQGNASWNKQQICQEVDDFLSKKLSNHVSVDANGVPLPVQKVIDMKIRELGKKTTIALSDKYFTTNTDLDVFFDPSKKAFHIPADIKYYRLDAKVPIVPRKANLLFDKIYCLVFLFILLFGISILLFLLWGITHILHWTV